MRKIIILILIFLIVLFSSIIIVDERQKAVIINYKNKERVESAGVHFIWPILDRVSYVFINERTSLLTFTISASGENNTPLQFEVLIDYHVVNPVDYLSAQEKLGKDGISKKITSSLEVYIVDKIKTDTLAKVNQQAQFLLNPNLFSSLGIVVDRMAILNIKFMAKTSQNTESKEDASVPKK